MKTSESLKKHIEERYGKSEAAELALDVLELVEKHNGDEAMIGDDIKKKISKIIDNQKGDGQ